MGFIKQQQVRLAVRLLEWKYQRMGLTIPAGNVLEKQARQVVDQAHQVARERGRNVVTIMKDLVNDMKNKQL